MEEIKVEFQDSNLKKVRWYYRPITVIILLFFVLGPLGIPLLVKSPKFRKSTKVILTIIVVIYTCFLVTVTKKAFNQIGQAFDIIQELTQ